MAARKAAKRSYKTSQVTSAKPAPAQNVGSQKRITVPIKRTYILIALILVLLGILAYYYKGLFVAATVNGQPISRVAVVTQLERQGGKGALDTMIVRTLILQEAKKRNVWVSDQDVNAQIKKIEDNMAKQGQKFDDALAIQGYTRNSFRDEYRIQMLVEKLLSKDIQVSDKEVNDYMEKNKDSLPQNQPPDQLKASVRQQLKQQKMNQKAQSWIQDLRSKAKIDYFVKY